jgi:hypothetical protein
MDAIFGEAEPTGHKHPADTAKIYKDTKSA